MAAISTEKKGPREKMLLLCNKLRQDILAGRIMPGVRLPSQEQLGQTYAVSPSTVAGVMTRLAHENLVLRIRGSGSFVAEELPTQHKVLDVLRVRNPAVPEASAVAWMWQEELFEIAGRHGWKACWYHIRDEQMENAEQLAKEFTNSKGVVCFYLVPPELPRLISQSGVPVVTIRSSRGGLEERAERFPQLSFDRRESARLATEHLVNLGYSRLGFVCDPYGVLRLRGFLDVVRRHELPLRAEWLLDIGDMTTDFIDLYPAVARLLKSQNRPEALCVSDMASARAVRTLATELGLQIPQDLALVAADEHIEGTSRDHRGPTTGFTCVSISIPKVWQRALELLDELSQHPGPKNAPLQDPIMMPLHLTVRDSCGAKLRGLHAGKDSGPKSEIEIERKEGR